MRQRILSTLVIVTAFVLIGCGEPPSEAEHRDADTGRWYTVDQVMRGGPVFAEHCAACHGASAEGAEEWFRRLPDGRWRSPPLNGSAHAWHHPLWQLRQHVREGSDPQHGTMPAFDDTLNSSEIDAVIAWFQSHWPNEIYEAWLVYDANTPEP